MRTLNVQRRTPNVERARLLDSFLQRSTFNLRRSTFAFLAITAITSQLHAQESPAKHRPLPSLLQWQATTGGKLDPLQSIDHEMGHIVDDLGDQHTDAPVQEKQTQVVGELDSIIKQLEEQMKKSGSGSGGPNPTKPAAKSTLAKGPGGSGPLHDPRAGTHDWGKLSDKQREQITQSQTEGFPPGYESVLSSYYNRLAQEKVGTESATQGPTTQPVK